VRSRTYLVLRCRKNRACDDSGLVERILSAAAGLGGRFLGDLVVPRSGSKPATTLSVACVYACWANSKCCVHL